MSPPPTTRRWPRSPRLSCDAVVIDLEDAVAPGDKIAAREKLADIFANRPRRRSRDGRAHQCAVQRMGRRRPCSPRRTASPTASCCPRSIRRATCWKPATCSTTTSRPTSVKLWAMIETPQGAAQHRRDRRTRPRPGLAAVLFRCRNERSGQGHRRAGDARPALSRALADADGAGRARRRPRRARRRQQRFSRPRRLCAANARRAPPWASTARR